MVIQGQGERKDRTENLGLAQLRSGAETMVETEQEEQQLSKGLKREREKKKETQRERVCVCFERKLVTRSPQQRHVLVRVAPAIWKQASCKCIVLLNVLSSSSRSFLSAPLESWGKASRACLKLDLLSGVR